MSEAQTNLRFLAAAVAAGALLVLDLALSTALVAVTSLSRVALRRMGAERSRLEFVENLRRPGSDYRLAAEVLRQASLIGIVWLLAPRLPGSDALAGLGLNVVFVGAVVVVLFENVMARTLALRHPRIALRLTTPLLRATRVLLYPVARPLHIWHARIEAHRASTEEERDDVQEEEVEALIEVGEREGLLEAEEGEMMRSIADLDETTAREIMTPRTDIIALPEESPVSAARRTVLDGGHSRLPVYRGTIDNITGILHARDLFRAWEERGESRPVGQFVRQAQFVPETSLVADLLSEMRQKSHMAMVVDEYGGIAGLVTLEDLLEEIVGEIRDEHETFEQEARQDIDGSWIISASTHVDKLESLFGLEFGERDFDTVGGFVITAFGRVPEVGERASQQGLQIEILHADRRRVHEVRLRPLQAPSHEQAADDGR